MGLFWYMLIHTKMLGKHISNNQQEFFTIPTSGPEAPILYLHD